MAAKVGLTRRGLDDVFDRLARLVDVDFLFFRECLGQGASHVRRGRVLRIACFAFLSSTRPASSTESSRRAI